MAACLLVGVVADEASRDTVESTRRSRRPSAGRDLVERAVQPVDPPLERDGEVNEVGAAAPLQRELRGPHPAQP